MKNYLEEMHDNGQYTYFTHKGYNHEDEQVGCAICELAGRTTSFQRVDDIEQCSPNGVIADIFRVYDPEKERYDHHQEFLIRDNGYPYASAGLLWKHYGKKAIKNVIKEELSQDWIDEIHEMVDQRFMIGVDAFDADSEYKIEGSCSAGKVSVMSTVKMVSLFNEDDPNSDAQNEIFYQNKEMYKRLITKIVLDCYGQLKDKQLFYKIVSIENNIAIVNQSIRWRTICYEHNKNNDEKIYFIIMPSLRPENKWTMFAMPVKPGSRKLIHPIENYEGFDGFVHNGKWIAASNDLESLRKLAEYSLTKNKRKFIELERAKRMEQHYGFFTGSTYRELFDDPQNFDLVYEKGKLHDRNEEFLQAVKTFQESRDIIYEILGL